MDSKIAAKAKEYLLEQEAIAYKNLKPGSGKYSYLPRHLTQVERWAKRLLGEHPEANGEVVLTAVWMHDIGLLIGSEEVDHAVNSEAEVGRFLPTVGADKDGVERVAHCVRAHRCKDVQPETLEAKIWPCLTRPVTRPIRYIQTTENMKTALVTAHLRGLAVQWRWSWGGEGT